MLLNAKIRQSAPRKYQWCGLTIERGLAGWHVYDWDMESDGETLRTLPTARDAEIWVERRQYGHTL